MTPETPRYCCRIQLTVSENQPVCSLSVDSLNIESNLSLDTKIVNEIIDVDPYEGSYDITPLAFNEQLLPTTGKYCDDDILVRSVPFYETSNVSGGYTVYIADGGDG